MIIGISGKAGCGKDTIGKIIQYLVARKDDTRSSKIQAAEFLGLTENNLRAIDTLQNWQIKKFAGKLKQITSILTGIPVESLEDEEIKKSWLGEEWENHFLGFEEPYTVRLFLQKLGTEAMRDNIHPNVWVNALMADYKPLYQHETLARCGGFKLISNDILPNWIITDVRFPNEAKAIKDRDGILIRVEREGFNAGTHPSETALDNYKHFDHIINNEGSIAELIESVSKILKEHGIN